MSKKLINDINRYIEHLNKQGLFVTVHGRGISGLLEHNVHSNPYCTLVKTDSEAWKKCVNCQQKVFREHKRGELFGMCYAGVEEFVFFVTDKTFVSVSGYGIDKEKALERINRISKEFYLDKNELINVYDNSLKHEKENVEVLIKPLCHMLYLLQVFKADISENETKNSVFDSLVAYVQYNFMTEISLDTIAQACACSPSTVSHLFKKHAGVSVMKYIQDLRMNQAKKLLTATDLSVSSIAQMCGFSNINYFPTAFKKTVGKTPTEYRQG